MNKFLLIVGLGVFAAGCSVKTETLRQRWEYKAVRVENDGKLIEESMIAKHEDWVHESMKNETRSEDTKPNEVQLDELGSDGWELATSYLEPETIWAKSDYNGESIPGRLNIRAKTAVLIFKRPRN